VIRRPFCQVITPCAARYFHFPEPLLKETSNRERIDLGKKQQPRRAGQSDSASTIDDHPNKKE